MPTETDLRPFITRIVASCVTYNKMKASDIPLLIQSVHEGLAGVLAGTPPPTPRTQAPARTRPHAQTPTPRSAAEIRKSRSTDWLISFENGRPYKCLKKHLNARNMSPKQYRDKWGLPEDYPMVAPSYSAKRADISRALGRRNRGGSESIASTSRKWARPNIGVTEGIR